MHIRRIIPCLDVKDGKVVKGVRFKDLNDIGYPPDMAEKYQAQSASEIVFLDITASLETRQTTLDLVSETVDRVFIPVTVGGGIRSADDAGDVLSAGAAKVSIGSAAIRDPNIIRECAERFGSPRIVVAIDAKKEGDSWKVYTRGGTERTDLDVVEWARRAEELGAGEILLTSMDADGVKEGYDIPLTGTVADAVSIPVVASGGCGSKEHIYEVLTKTKAAGALAASLFHYDECGVDDVKKFLREEGVQVR
ncbi:MAG: imidazole glycerol phosphate synthase subunit HisF [Thermoplasmatales archaeon]|jgi:cyclase|nr:imidazole glycerol phosphate synthase subunit HisF [Thermoplasmatales archaeon]